MSLRDLRERIAARLDESDRGDRGWFIITRVHVALVWLQGIAGYLHNRGGSDAIRLSAGDYQRLGEIIESDNADPGVQLRRHHLLVMEKPLQLLRRTDQRSWREVSLTDRGRELGQAADPGQVLERCLAGIRFAVEPWSPPQRVEEYPDFDVRVYRVARQVVDRCEGYVDRNEFDFFLSRIRSEDEVAWAVDGIHGYRRLSPVEQESLHREVRDRVPSEKRYQNWRDVGLHTFSLFSLGTSFIRDGQRLLRTAAWTAAYAAESPVRLAHTPQLRIPEPPELDELLTPPAAPASNAGTDGESFVAKVLRSQGWHVAFYTNRRGFGFDLWARRGEAVMLVEVKSSLGVLGAVSLTALEHQAAERYRDNFVLALVEELATDRPVLWMIQNPVARMIIERREALSFTISRSEWRRVAESER